MLFEALGVAITPFKGKGLGKYRPVNWAFQNVASKVISKTMKTTEINGYKINVKLGEGRPIGGVVLLLLFMHEYEPTTTEVFKEYAKEGSTVIDIGANIGYFTLLAAQCVGGKGKVVAIEPEEMNAKDLCANVALNGFTNVEIVKAAVSNKPGIAKLNVSAGESGEHSLVIPKSRKYAMTQDVKLITIDDLYIRNISLIKIDTEGHEYEVIEGAIKTLQKYYPPLIIEIWPEGLNTSGHSVEEFGTLINSIGYNDISVIDEYKKEVRKASWGEIESHSTKHGFSTNVLCKRTVNNGLEK
jgi:FkbM family methyltransferase